MPCLLSLHVSGVGALGRIELPELRSFELDGGGALASHEARSIATAHWPKLETLRLRIGSPAASGPPMPDLLAELLEARGVPGLKNLALEYATCADALAEAVARSALAPQLEELSFDCGGLTSRGARILVENRSRFARLSTVSVMGCFIDAPEVEQLEASFPPFVQVNGQFSRGEPDPEPVSDAYEETA